MKIKSIIAALVLAGSSTAAMAAPVTISGSAQAGVTINAGFNYGRPVVRDHRVITTTAPAAEPCDEPAVQPVAYDPGYGRWHRETLLGGQLQFANDGRKFITVGADKGRFQDIKVSAAGGQIFLKEIYVQFDNGQEQVLRNIDRTLSGNQTFSLDLDGNYRAIRRVVVYGSQLGNGWMRGPNGRWIQQSSTFTLSAI
jgi:hypothetical protein